MSYCYGLSCIVRLSIGLSVCNVREPCKLAERIKMPFGILSLMGQRNYVLDGDSNLPTEGALLRGITSRFVRTPPSTISSGPYVGISPPAVDQHSDWPATEAVMFHIKFSQ